MRKYGMQPEGFRPRPTQEYRLERCGMMGRNNGEEDCAAFPAQGTMLAPTHRATCNSLGISYYFIRLAPDSFTIDEETHATATNCHYHFVGPGSARP